jgi:hypothetical protein
LCGRYRFVASHTLEEEMIRVANLKEMMAKRALDQRALEHRVTRTGRVVVPRRSTARARPPAAAESLLRARQLDACLRRALDNNTIAESVVVVRELNTLTPQRLPALTVEDQADAEKELRHLLDGTTGDGRKSVPLDDAGSGAPTAKRRRKTAAPVAGAEKNEQ